MSKHAKYLMKLLMKVGTLNTLKNTLKDKLADAKKTNWVTEGMSDAKVKAIIDSAKSHVKNPECLDKGGKNEYNQ